MFPLTLKVGMVLILKVFESMQVTLDEAITGWIKKNEDIKIDKMNNFSFILNIFFLFIINSPVKSWIIVAVFFNNVRHFSIVSNAKSDGSEFLADCYLLHGRRRDINSFFGSDTEIK